MNFQRTKPTDSIWNNQAFLSIVPLVLFLAILLAVIGVHKAIEASAKAGIELEKKAWASCGKPFGKPCDCVPGSCKCGIFKGFTCANCRPMK